MILALEYSRSATLPSRALSRVFPGVVTSPATPLRLITRPTPRLPGPGWARLRPLLSGISAADLRLLTTGYPAYLSALMSHDFVPGHEVVGVLADDLGPDDLGPDDLGPDDHGSADRGRGDHDRDRLPAGTRVVLDPVLGCAARGVEPCVNCAAGRANRCDRLTAGALGGLGTGVTAETGGGWSEELIAHRSQLHRVPDRLTDEQALLVQPLARALHLVERAGVDGGTGQVLVVGAGLTGLLTCWAIGRRAPGTAVTVVAKHPRQLELAAAFGATDVLAAGDALRGVRRTTRATRVASRRGRSLPGPDFLLGGVDVAIDAAGSASAFRVAVHSTRAGGRVVGSAGSPHPSPALWLRELDLVGSYAAAAADYTEALQLVSELPVDGLVGARYGLRQWRQAIDHAQARGKSGTVKVAFQL